MRRKHWRLIWLFWFLAVVVIIAGSFAVLETLSWERGLTLSHVTAELPKPWIFVLGFCSGTLIGSLTTHFWWHWSGR